MCDSTNESGRPRWWVCDRCGNKYSMNITKCLFKACPTNLESKPRPLDRGKVSQWISFHRRTLYDGTIVIDPDELREAIDSGRLDVDHIEDTLGMVKEAE